jgi:hypothetical protein
MLNKYLTIHYYAPCHLLPDWGQCTSHNTAPPSMFSYTCCNWCTVGDANITFQFYILSHVRVTLDRVYDWTLDLLTHLSIVTTRNCNSLTELHTPNITVTTAHIKSSLSTRCFMVTNFNTGDSSTSALTTPTKSSLHTNLLVFSSQSDF